MPRLADDLLTETRRTVRPDDRFLRQPKPFWANVRTISEKHGYANKAIGVKVPSLVEVKKVYAELGLTSDHVAKGSTATEFGALLMGYFEYRAEVLNNQVRHMLMTAEEARTLFDAIFSELNPQCPLPMNKQKGDMKARAFMTGLVNMLVEKNIGGEPCDYDPRVLTTVTREGVPVRTLARRVDGAFPSPVNPIALWEIKEYYYTTSFGSRVADSVYESLLDGMELEELREHEGIDVKHYLFIDAFDTWWNDGRSYLCRMIDMLHMGYVDEIIFGREVIDRIPILAKEWVAALNTTLPTTPEDTGTGH